MAATEVRAATREIIHDRTVLASAQTLAETVDLRQVCHTLQMALATTTDFAYALREATPDPHLQGSARGVNALAIAVEANGPYVNASTQGWVRPADHAQGRRVALPYIVRDSLTRAADYAAQVATTAAGAAAFVGVATGTTAPTARGTEPGSGRVRTSSCG